MDMGHRRVMRSCYFAFLIVGIGSLMIGAIMPALLRDFNKGYDYGGLLLSLHSMGNFVASFIAGIIAVYIGRKNALLLVSASLFIGFAGMAMTGSSLVLLITFFLTGFGRGSLSNIANIIVNDVSEGDPAPLNILHTFFAVGAFLAPFFAAWVIKRGMGWRFTLVTISALALVMIIVFFLTKIDNHRGEIKKTGEGSARSLDFLKSLDFHLSTGILFFYVALEYSINGWVVTYLQDTGLMSPSLAQTTLSLLWVIIIFGRLFSAYISKTVDKKTILLLSSLGGMIFFGLFMLASQPFLIILSILGLGFCIAGIYPTGIANAGEVLKGSSLAMGLLLGISGFGAIAMSYITGIVAERVGIAGGMVSISVAAVLMFVLALINKFRPKRV